MGSFLDPDYVRSVKVGRGGQSGTAVKDQGSHDLASEYGAQRACCKASVHWDRKGSNPITVLFHSILHGTRTM